MPEECILAEFNEIVIGAKVIREHVGVMAEQVKRAYADSDRVAVIVLLEGARRFAGDLLGIINEVKFEIYYVKASSYHGGTRSSGKVVLEGLNKKELGGREVLIVDDIYDTGLTLGKVLDEIGDCGASGVMVCVLLEKDVKHVRHVKTDFAAMKVADKFLVGYGLDYNGKYRELDYVAALDVNKL